MIEIIKCSRCKIKIDCKEFSGCDDCSDEYEDTEGIHLCGNCCILYNYLQSNLYDDFLDNKVHLTQKYRIYHQPERSKREDSRECEMRCSEHCGNTVREAQ